MSYCVFFTFSYPSLKQCTLAAKCRSLCSGIRNNSIHAFLAKYCATISSVRSVEPSLIMIHFFGKTVCEMTDCIVCSINASSFRAGVIKTYEQFMEYKLLLSAIGRLIFYKTINKIVIFTSFLFPTVVRHKIEGITCNTITQFLIFNQRNHTLRQIVHIIRLKKL